MIDLREIAPAARADDPETSHIAAGQAGGLAEDHRDRIAFALAAHGPMGKDAIARVTNLTGVAVARRLPELQREGRAAPTGRLVLSESGRPEREWGIAP